MQNTNLSKKTITVYKTNKKRLDRKIKNFRGIIKVYWFHGLIFEEMFTFKPW